MLRESVPVPLNHNTPVWTCGTKSRPMEEEPREVGVHGATGVLRVRVSGQHTPYLLLEAPEEGKRMEWEVV